MSLENEKQKIARETLKILRVEIGERTDPIEALNNIQFVMMSSIELDIWKTTKQLIEYLSQNKTELASSLLGKLKDLVSASDWE